MFKGFAPRWAAALALVAVATALVFALTRDPAAAAVTLLGSAAALLAVAGPADASAALPASPLPVLPQPADPLLGEVLDQLVGPVLLVAGGIVTLANAPARALLGGHVVGEDVRVAIRHPAAAERLAAAAPVAAPPVELVGLGRLDQRWRMQVGVVQAGDGPDAQRVVQLVDETGNYAAERMRVDFVANASHELRTPLAAVLGFVETLQGEAGADPALRARFLRIVEDEARRMERLVEDLMSLSRIEAEKYRAPRSPVDLATLVDEVRGELAGIAGDRALLAELPGGGATVSGDRAQLSQLLHNLAGNALKYGRAGTPVLLRVAAEAGMWRLSVTDEGDGIAARHIPRLTERFYRVDAGRSRALGGTGLGLAIVKHVVERHRGRLDIASVVGKGTTVTVVLPMARDPLRDPSHGSSRGPSWGRNAGARGGGSADA